MAKDKTIQNKLENFNQQVNVLKNRYQTKSMMEILGVKKEMTPEEIIEWWIN